MTGCIVYLIRHASPRYPLDSAGRRLVYGPTAELTPEGREKAAALARRIVLREGGPLDVLVASPYQRAAETAEILAREMRALDSGAATQVISGPMAPTLIADDRLRDTRSVWAGTLMDEFLRVFEEGKTFDDPRTQETLEELARRMKDAHDELTAQFEGMSVGLVSHGDPIRALYWRLVHPDEPFPPYRDLVKQISLGAAQGLRLGRDAEGHVEQEIVDGSTEGRS